MKLRFLSDLVKPFERVSAPGASPGTVLSNPDQPAPVIRVMAYSEDKLEELPLDSLDGLPELAERFDVTWVNVDGLGDADVIAKLGEMFQLHRLALEDVVNTHQRPKVESYEGNLFIVARMVEVEEELDTEQICFFLRDGVLLTFQEGKPGDCLDPVRERLRRASGRIRARGVDYLTYALLDCIIDHYFPVIERYGERLDDLDDELMDSDGDTSIAAIHRFRSELLLLRRSIRPHREAVNSLIRDPFPEISEETRLYLRDCYDHTIQLSEAIDTYRETCSDLRDFHLSAMSNRTNDVMKTLTIIATIFIPLSFIAGVFGMNFEHMPWLDWRYGFEVSMILMVGAAASLVLWFRRKGWFGRTE